MVGPAMAAEQNQPAILASLANSDSVITLDHQRMEQIEGTWLMHPDLKASIIGFYKDPCGTIKLHIQFYRDLLSKLCQRPS